MTGLAPTSSSFHYQWTYDVFINFCGKDTRHGFIGNLYNALKNAGVRTFLDDEELRRGDEITPTLLQSIENSRTAIAVFSKNYASSTFCLNELVKIHECIKRMGRLVWPIFYDVEPSEVRHQKDHYEQALAVHIKNLRANEDKIHSWKLALHEVSNISGDHFNPRQGYEYQFIEKIVKEISNKINRVPLYVSDYPVGLESRVKEITSLLQIGSNEKALMVGIYGMGGLGKTTIARALYNSVADNFEGFCFLHDVKGKSKKLGLERIQETIFSKILGVDINISDVNEGVQVIKKRFKEKKILLILDDVENQEQLKKLGGGCDWFSAGSRIIITTRDEQLLVAHGVESRYGMEVLNHGESLKLFSWKAFKNHQVDPCYKDVLDRAVTYANGLPLALEVIGSNLCGKTINEWESALDAYKKSLHKDIEQVLRVSYEDLEEIEKEIFLDIACFFEGKELEYVKYMVEVVHDSNNLSYSIGVLVDKCLIKIEKSFNYIQMHDLIRDMGRKIVQEESPNNPGERSRLWFHKDIVDVLEHNTGTNKVRMIGYDNWRECIEVNWDGEAFKSMKELKILIFGNVKFSEDPKYLPESLKVLKWGQYPFSCLPPNFSPKKLVVLDIGYSCLSSSETIIKTSDNLAILKLEGCKYVKEIPDLSNLINLKQLRLWNCQNLIEIHDSVGYLPKLEILNVDSCVRLKTFPHAIKLPSLTMLGLQLCSSLKYFPEILETVKIRELSLEKTGIKKLPWSICNLAELRHLEIYQKKSVIEIPNSIFLLPEIEDITVNITGKVISCNLKEGQEHAIWSKQCLNRVKFDLPRCNISDDVLRIDFSRYMNVRYLNLSGNDFTILPAWMKECHFLETIKLNECRHLREVEGVPPNIRRLEARNCVSLSLESRNIILSEELHGAPGRYYSSEDREPCEFWVPSRSIPKWFDHKGASISFWFRNSFPTLCLCHLVKAKSNSFHVRVDINEEPAFCRRFPSSQAVLDDDHLVVYILKWDDMHHYKIERLSLEEHQWYHAQVVRVARVYGDDEDVVMEESGMYVIKQLCEMEDITFINPYPQKLDSTWGSQGKPVRSSLITTRGSDDEYSMEDFFTFPDLYCQELDSIWGNQAEQVGTRIEEKEVVVNKKRELMGNDNFASSSTTFISTKRARGSPINFNAITPQVPFDLSSTEACLVDLDFYTTSMTGYACDTFGNQGNSIEDDKCLSLRPCWETSLYDDESANLQELPQEKDATSTNIDQILKSFEDTRKAKGKERIIYDDTINE